MRSADGYQRRIAARLQSNSFDSYRERGLWSGKALFERFAATAERLADQPMLLEHERCYSFAEVAETSSSLAAGLAAGGVTEGTAIAYQLPNWWEAATVFLATLRLGAHVVPIVPILRVRELSAIFAETAPRFIFTTGEAEQVACIEEAVHAAHPGQATLVATRGDNLPTTFTSLLETTAVEPVPPVEPESLAAVIYTSGSTAAPKGALHLHETLGAELDSLVAAHELGPQDRVLMPSPLGHISGVIHGILAPALLGTSAVLQARWDPLEALRAIERHSVTYMIGAPVFLQEILAHPDFASHDLSSLRLFSCGGAPVRAALLAEARDKLPGLIAKRVYGSSEFPTITTTDTRDAESRGLDSEGKALRGIDIRIAAEDGSVLGSNTEGEVRARGPECFLGYTDPDLDAAAFDEEGYLRSGDLGVLDDEGYLRITGRLKEIIVRKGENISAREVEGLILDHSGVEEVAVIPLPDPERGELACACTLLKDSSDVLSLEDLAAFLREHGLTTQKIPERLEIVTSLPRTASGKIDKRELVRRFST